VTLWFNYFLSIMLPTQICAKNGVMLKASSLTIYQH